MTERHRGAHPQDHALFAPDQWPRLREAVFDLSWLFGRGYNDTSALKLVGDRWGLTTRQRLAVLRGSCSDQARAHRKARRVSPEALQGEHLLLDGFNVIMTTEVALSGGIIFLGRDGCYRDLASIHGTYRSVMETLPSLVLLGEALEARKVARCTWYLDRPVSNSGRLKALILETAAERGWRWGVELVTSPDAVLAAAKEIIVTADSAILDRCARWFPLTGEVIPARTPKAFLVDLCPEGAFPEGAG